MVLKINALRHRPSAPEARQQEATRDGPWQVSGWQVQREYQVLHVRAHSDQSPIPSGARVEHKRPARRQQGRRRGL